MRRAALIFLIAASCSDDDPGVSRGDAGMVAFLDGGACAAPLIEFCEGKPCPTFNDSVAEVMRLALASRCFIAESGSCGPLRYTYHSTGFGGFQAWFDDGGTLLAARRFSDINEYCNNSSREEQFGAIPICDRVPAAMYCPR